MASKKDSTKKSTKAKKAAAPVRAGVQMTPVKVGGEIYRSVPEAFSALGLKMSRMTKFRTEVKANGRATYVDDDGKKFNFIAQEPGSYVAPAAE